MFNKLMLGMSIFNCFMACIFSEWSAAAGWFVASIAQFELISKEGRYD